MTSELSPEDQRILERYLNRKNSPRDTSPNTEPIPPQRISEFSVDNIITNGKTFYDDKIPIALKQALDYSTLNGIVATMPELISAKIKAPKSHDFWQSWYSVHTEENIGIDKKGRFYKKDEPVLIVVNGGGILTPDRINKAYTDGLVDGSAKYTDKEFNDLLDGKLPDNTSIQLYKFEEIKKGITLPHKFGVVMPYSLAQKTSSGYYKKDGFTKNPLVIARAGGIENLEQYYELAKAPDNDLGNYHAYDGRDTSTPSGRLLFLYSDYDGLNGDDYLDNYGGRFVGVAPEAHGKKK